MREGKLKFGVVVFPGSNCDHDVHYILERVLNQDVTLLWHKDASLNDVDVVVLPGGFSYGDYLRCGAIASTSPIMREVMAFANRGGIVIGVCNGFQILCEAGLLPGALLRNDCRMFVCKPIHVKVENTDTCFTSQCQDGEVLCLPIAHGEGKYEADDKTIQLLEENNRVLFRYCDCDGAVTAVANPNGSRNNIAGIINERGNVMGLMPHPERAADPALGITDGQKIFISLIESNILHQYSNDLIIEERS